MLHELSATKGSTEEPAGVLQALDFKDVCSPQLSWPEKHANSVPRTLASNRWRSSLNFRCPTQRSIQVSGARQTANVSDSGIALKILGSQSYRPIGIIEFLRAFASSPVGFEIRQDPSNLIAIDAITTFIRPASGCVLDARPRNNLRHHFCEFTDAIIFFRSADVENFIVNRGFRRPKNADDRGNDVTDMHDRAPGGTVALNKNLTCCVGRGDKVV